MSRRLESWVVQVVPAQSHYGALTILADHKAHTVFGFQQYSAFDEIIWFASSLKELFK